MAKIMVVDDEPQILNTVRAVLEDAGYEVATALSALECLRALKREKPDLLLVDYFMPETSGMQLIEKIRRDKEFGSVKIALFTVGDFSEVWEEDLDKMEVSDYIHKPFDNQDLVSRVKRILGE